MLKFVKYILNLLNISYVNVTHFEYVYILIFIS